MRTEGNFLSRLNVWFSSSPDVSRKTDTHTQISQHRQATRVFLPSDESSIYNNNNNNNNNNNIYLLQLDCYHLEVVI